MAVPVSAALFAKTGMMRINHASPQICEKKVCCLHGASCPGDGGNVLTDTTNGPQELLERVESYLNSTSIQENEIPVYKTVQFLLTTLIVQDEEKNDIDGGVRGSQGPVMLRKKRLERVSSSSMAEDILMSQSNVLFKDKEKPFPKVFIHPSSPGRLTWDFISLFIVLVDSIILPFQISFYDNAPADGWFWFGTIFFTIDILINFITGYVAGPLEQDHGKLVTDKKRIVMWYLKSWFIIDFISTVPWQEIFQGGGSGSRAAKAFKIAKLARFLRLVRLLKLLKLQDMWTKIEYIVGNMFVVQALQLLRVLALVIYVCHWNACIWWVIGSPVSIISTDENGFLSLDPHWTTRLYHQTFRNDEGEEVIRKFRWIDEDIGVTARYAFCFYWTLGVMRTMPQEAFPTNTLERLYTLIFMFFAFSMFSICITKITQMFNKINLRRQEFNEHMAHVRSYMHENDVDQPLQEKIIGFLEHRFTRRRIFAKEHALFNELSEPLRIEIRCAQLAPALSGIWLFNALGDTEIKKIVPLCTTHDYAPGDIVCEEDAIAFKCRVLVFGRLSIIDPSTVLTAKRFENAVPVVSCDMECLLFDQPASSERSVWAIDYSEMVGIEKEDFQNLRKLEPTIEQHIRMLQNSNCGLAIREKLFARSTFIRGANAVRIKDKSSFKKTGGTNQDTMEGAAEAAMMAG